MPAHAASTSGTTSIDQSASQHLFQRHHPRRVVPLIVTHITYLITYRFSKEKFGYIGEKTYLCNEINIDYMARTEYITVKNAPMAVLKRMRKIGVDKAKRLQRIQEHWDNGDYKNVEIVQL